ncbi:MAG: hypothetical protein H6618_08720 [Deltaproteobacteria bacterium]|nr:hypothetical protein [Deltaproteobacteria bacterium]
MQHILTNASVTKMMPILKISRSSLDGIMQLLNQTLGFQYQSHISPLTVMHSEKCAPEVWLAFSPENKKPEIDSEQLLVFYGETSDVIRKFRVGEQQLWPQIRPHNPFWQRSGGFGSKLPDSWGVIFMPELWCNDSSFRLARPTSQPFDDIINFYKSFPGLPEEAQFHNHDGFNGLSWEGQLLFHGIWNLAVNLNGLWTG